MSKSASTRKSSSQKAQLRRRLVIVALAVVIGLISASALAYWQIRQDKSRVTELAVQASSNPPSVVGGQIGGPFTLIDQNGATVSDTAFRGKYLLVYFGFTYCPDMCPTGLQNVARTLDLLGPDASKVQGLFITIDPERDTPAVLKEYAASFHPDIIGLTGTKEQIAAVAKAYKVYYAKAEQVDDKNYMMDHSTVIYVMDPDGHYIDTFPQDIEPKKLADTLRVAWNKPASK